MTTTPGAFDAIAQLYDAGQYHAALRAGAQLSATPASRDTPPGAALRDWPGSEGRILAARIAARLGAQRLAQGLIWSAFRSDPRDPRVTYYYAWLVIGRRGPWHALQWLRAHQPGPADTTADLMALEGRALAQLRDFDRGSALLARARDRDPTSPWIPIEQSVALELEDRIDDAIAACDEALSLRAHYRPALVRKAQLLTSVGRHEEALSLLALVPHAEESWEVLLERAAIARSMGRSQACADDLSGARAAALLAEKHLLRAIARGEAEALYLLRRYRAAEARARDGDSPFARAFAAELTKLAEGAPPPRVELHAVPHIRQHHVTCAPASLAQITAYHGDPVDHLELAETICYAGTPAHRQRAWAEERGYRVRELDLTLDATRALIDAGLPFVLTTAGTASAHAQVVIGYDLARRTVLVRDPSTPSLVELELDAMLKSQAWNGPPAMVLVPRAKADVLDGLELPSAALWDLRHRLNVALETHDLPAAESAILELERAAPGSRHALDAKLALATYRERPDEQLAALDALLALHPDTPVWVLRRGEAMRGRRPRAERLAFWERYAQLDDPTFLEAFAEELRFEGARQEDAARLLRRALRIHPTSGLGHHVYADLRASRGDDDAQVLESYRFAVTCDISNEHFARAYFEHARRAARDDEALTLLQQRVLRAGARAIGPARTLFEVHSDSGNPERGLTVLARLAEDRPDDGDLYTTLAHASLMSGDASGARRWLARGEGKPARLVDRALAEARVARAEGALEAARVALERALDAAPERTDVVANHAQVLSELEGNDAVLRALEAARERAPASTALIMELCVRLRGHDDERARALLEERLRDHPDDQWNRRELALVLAALGRTDDALRVAGEAVAMMPHDSYASSVLGAVLDRTDRHEEGRAALRRAVELDIDNASAIQQLATRASSPDQRRDDARFVLGLHETHVSGGAGLIEASHLASVLPHEERASRLARLLERAPHRPDAWEAVARARVESGDLDGADETARRACERFPRWSSLRHLRAYILRLRGDLAGAERELHELCSTVPTWTQPRIELSSLLEERGAREEALALIDEALARSPRSTALKTERALLVWNGGDRDLAFDTLLAVVRGDFQQAPAFEQLRAWTGLLGRTAEVEAMLVEEHGRDRRSALAGRRLGSLLIAPSRASDRIRFLREAIERAPRSTATLDLLAEALCAAERFDEALAVCPPSGWPGAVPVPMRGRRAWVLAARGDRDAAIAEMKAVLADDPSYDWGRRTLCDWLEASEQISEFVEQAAQLVAQAPTLATSHVYFGDAKLRAGDSASALEAFDRAVAIAPDHAYAVSRSIELLIGARRLPDARARIQRGRHTLPPYEIARLEIEVASAADEHEDALAALDALMSCSAPQPVLEAGLATLARSAIASRAFERVEDRLARTDDPAPIALGWAWANVRERVTSRGAMRLLSRHRRLGAAGRAAIASWLEVMALRRSRALLAWVGVRHYAWLRASDETWAAIGYALAVLGWSRACAWWSSDWRSRPGAAQAMLYPLVLASWDLGRAERAAEVVERALALTPDQTAAPLHAWRALHHALAGRLSMAETDLAAATAGPAPANDDVFGGVLDLTRAVLAGLRVSETATAAELIEAVCEELQRACSLTIGQRTLRAPYRAAVTAIVARRSMTERWSIRWRLPSAA